MAIATSNLPKVMHGKEGYIFDLPVAAATHLYDGTLISQLTATGGAVPYSTASSEHCAGIAQHEIDNSAGLIGAKRIRIETARMANLANGAGADAFLDTDFIGAPVYATDDHVAAKTSGTNTRKPIGFFYGLEVDGRVRVFIDPVMARLYAALAALTDTPATADALRDNLVAKAAI